MEGKVPDIRFKGFEDPWNNKNLKDLSNSIDYGLGAAAKDYDGENKYIRITDIDDESREFSYKDLSSPDIDLASAERYKLSHGDIVFARTGASVGKTYIYDPSYGVVYYAGFLIRVKIKNEFNPQFIFQNTLTNRYNKFVQITSMRSGQPGINANEYSQFEIMLPNKKEQDSISDYLRSLDNLLILQRRKMNNLTTLKKSCLDKMFPKDGSLVPELRFAGFTEPWKKTRLGNIGKAQSGIGFPDSEQGGSEGIPFFKVSDMNIVGNENEMVIANNYVTPTQIEKNNWNPINELPAIFFAKVGAAVLLNRKRLCLFPFLLDNNTMAYSLDNKKWNKDFAKVLFDTINLPSLVQVGALPSYNAGDIEAIEVNLPPSMLEQIQIGSFFRNLDNLVVLHQQKLDKLKNLKKAFLDKMFV